MIQLASRSSQFQSLDGFEACHRSVEAFVYVERKDKTVARHWSASWTVTLVSFVSAPVSASTDNCKFAYRFDNMASVFVHLPSYFALNGFNEPSSQETGPYADVFDRTYWQRVNGTPKLTDDFHTYMAAHKKGCSSIVDLSPLSLLVDGYDKSSQVLLVDIGGGVGHQSRELRARYPYLEGDIVVQDLQVSKELELAGVRGMQYDFFTPQPIKCKLSTSSSTPGSF